MYDKLRFQIIRTRGTTEFSHLANVLDDCNEITNRKTKEHRCVGRLGNLVVSEKPWGLSIVGSLNKWYHNGNNIEPFSRLQMVEAINNLSEELCVDVWQANVSAMEFGYNFLTKFAPESYLGKLGAMPRRIRKQLTKYSLYYSHRGKKQPEQLTFYDKVEEFRANRYNKLFNVAFPDEYKGKHILRAEARYDGSLARLFKQDQVNMARLCEPDFYGIVRDDFTKRYEIIQKIESLSVNYRDMIRTPKEGYEAFFALILMQQSNCNEQIEQYVQNLKDANVYKDRKDYVRLKKKLCETVSRVKSGAMDEQIKELNELFQAVREIDR